MNTSFCALVELFFIRTEPLLQRLHRYKYVFWPFKVTLKIGDTAPLKKTVAVGMFQFER